MYINLKLLIHSQTLNSNFSMVYCDSSCQQVIDMLFQIVICRCYRCLESLHVIRQWWFRSDSIIYDQQGQL